MIIRLIFYYIADDKYNRFFVKNQVFCIKQPIFCRAPPPSGPEAPETGKKKRLFTPF